MPTIKKLERKNPYKRDEHTLTRDARRVAYNDVRWRKLRLQYMSNHPVCEECLKEGRVYAGGGDRGTIQVHHRKSFLQNGNINWDLFLDENNLETVCATCHGNLHGGHELSPEDIIAQLEALMDGNISDEDIENGNF